MGSNLSKLYHRRRYRCHRRRSATLNSFDLEEGPTTDYQDDGTTSETLSGNETESITDHWPLCKRKMYLDEPCFYAAENPPANYNHKLFPWKARSGSSVADHTRASSFSDAVSIHINPLVSDDPIVASARHNETRPLYKLPASVLLTIIRELDDVSIECFRRAARRFPPFCAEVIIYRNPWKNYNNNNAGPFPWPKELRLGWATLMTAQFMRLLDKDRYCRGCLTARQAPDWLKRVKRLRRYLHCSACHVEHPACLFSAAERVKSSRQRRCIGHEGYVRICGHDEGIMRWSHILHLVRERTTIKRLWRYPQEGWRCTHKSHLTACGRPEFALDREDAPEECREETEVFFNESNNLFPSLQVFEENAIHLTWDVHLPLGRLGKWPPTASALRHLSGEIRDNAGRFIVPAGMKLPELRCFDPNMCDCVDYQGSGNVDWHPYRPICNNAMGHQCYTNPESRLVPPTPLLDSSLPGLYRLRHMDSFGPVRVCDDYGRCELKQKTHVARISYRSASRLSNDSFSMSANVCHNLSPCLRLRYSRVLENAFSADGKLMMLDWYHALDTESYNLTQDKQGFEVFWCREPHCRNYFENHPDFDALVTGCFYPYDDISGNQRLEYHHK